MLLRYLPPDSAVAREVDGGWTLADHMLANLVDLAAWANHQRGGGKGSKPKPIKRPRRKRNARDDRVRDWVKRHHPERLGEG